MSKITPHLWFATEAVEAAHFYASVFPNAKVTAETQIKNTPSGDCDIVSFEISGQPFMAISAGPLFKINPSISFLVNFDPTENEDARELLDDVWEKLIEGGSVMMPLQPYPHSERYGWLQDKYGVSWQLMLTNPDGEPRPFIIPSLLYTQAVTGKAEEAIDFYCSVFKDSKKGMMAHYPEGAQPGMDGQLMFGEFHVQNTWLAAMDGGPSHAFTFNEALSLLIPCENQADIDYCFETLSAVPEAEQCGWLKDQYGVSWQVWPTRMGEMMSGGTPEQIERVTRSFLTMKKFDLATLERAYKGE